MSKLETRFTWRVQDHKPLPDRVLHYADGILSLKEVEYLGTPASGTFKERAAHLMEQILAAHRGPPEEGQAIGNRARAREGPAARVPGDPARPRARNRLS